jgi:hypothetical protein
MGHPTGMLVTGLVYYFKEFAKAYNKAADKLGAIGDAIESGSTCTSQPLAFRAASRVRRTQQDSRFRQASTHRSPRRDLAAGTAISSMEAVLRRVAHHGRNKEARSEARRKGSLAIVGGAGGIRVLSAAESPTGRCGAGRRRPPEISSEVCNFVPAKTLQPVEGQERSIPCERQGNGEASMEP